MFLEFDKMLAMPSNAMIIRVLLEASRILEVRGWTRRALARDAKGRTCSIDSSDAVSYCLCGALIKAWRTLDYDNEDLYHKFFQKKFSEILREKYKYDFTFTQWNDCVAASKGDVVKLIRDMIDAILVEQSAIERSCDAPCLSDGVTE